MKYRVRYWISDCDDYTYVDEGCWFNTLKGAKHLVIELNTIVFVCKVCGKITYQCKNYLVESDITKYKKVSDKDTSNWICIYALKNNKWIKEINND